MIAYSFPPICEEFTVIVNIKEFLCLACICTVRSKSTCFYSFFMITPIKNRWLNCDHSKQFLILLGFFNIILQIWGSQYRTKALQQQLLLPTSNFVCGTAFLFFMIVFNFLKDSRCSMVRVWGHNKVTTANESAILYRTHIW